MKHSHLALAIAVALAGFYFVVEAQGQTPSPPASVPDTGQGQKDGKGVPAKDATPAPAEPNAKGSSAAADKDKPAAPAPALSYSALLKKIEEKPEEIKSVTIVNGANQAEITFADGKTASVSTPGAKGVDTLVERLTARGIEVSARTVSPPPSASGGWSSHLGTFGPVVLLVLAMVLIAVYQRRGAGGQYKGFTNSQGKAIEKGNFRPVAWDEIAGCDEAVREVQRVVTGLGNTDVYLHFKAKRPKGILLIGPPGNGKTLLARAAATATEGTMEVVSAASFVEMFVGVGSARVRSLVANGERNIRKTGKPHYIFIDELDAVGGHRSNGPNRHEEREATLNQILEAMDGLASSEDIIWIAATNRPEMLDEALLRPGRFDCHVYVDRPDKAGREKIFAIHTRNKPISPEVSMAKLAARTYGYSGAEIELVCNRAALLAAERWALDNQVKLKEARAKNGASGSMTPEPRVYAMAMAGFVTTYVPHISPEEKKRRLEEFISAACKDDATAVILLKDFDEAADFVRYGDARQSRQDAMPESEKRNTAVHEAGHAIAAAVMPFSDPVSKITIMNRSRALGYVQQVPEGDRFSMNMQQLISRIVTCMAGAAAQEHYLQTVDTGAENDYSQGVALAHQMVTDWGMSRLGRISSGRRTSMSSRGGGSAEGGMQFGPALLDAIDVEWRRIIDMCYAIAMEVVISEKARMDRTVAMLLEEETILKDQWQALLAEIPSAAAQEKLTFDPRKKESTESK